MKNRKCQICAGDIKISVENDPGDMVFCMVCEREYELLSLNPLRLRPLDYYEENPVYGRLYENEFDERGGYW